jgi:hypothetical protein
MKEPAGPWRGTGVLATPAISNKTEEWGRDLVTGNNLLALYGIENVGGFEAIIPRSYFVFSEAAGARISPAGRTLQFTKFESPLLDFLGLKHVLLPATLPMPTRFRRLETFGSVTLFENRAALPRARMTTSVIAANEQEAEQVVRSPKFDPRRDAVIESDHPLAAGEGEVVWKDRTPDRIALEVVAKADGVLVVADTDYPGWEATVDGAPTPDPEGESGVPSRGDPGGDPSRGVSVPARLRPSRPDRVVSVPGALRRRLLLSGEAVKRAWPYALFGAITLACFWKFVFLGWTLYDVRTFQRPPGHASRRAAGWFASHRPAVDRGDTILVLPMLHRIYNEGPPSRELRLWNRTSSAAIRCTTTPFSTPSIPRT